MTATTATARKVTAYLCANGASEAIEFYKRAFGAEELYRMEDGGRIGHAEFTIGDSVLYISDEWPEMHVLSPKSLGGHSTSFVLSVPDADSAFGRAIGAGAVIERPLRDEPYGRTGWLVDPFGHRWCISQPNPDFDPSKM
jgi:PhnB protein